MPQASAIQWPHRNPQHMHHPVSMLGKPYFTQACWHSHPVAVWQAAEWRRGRRAGHSYLYVRLGWRIRFPVRQSPYSPPGALPLAKAAHHEAGHTMRGCMLRPGAQCSFYYAAPAVLCAMLGAARKLRCGWGLTADRTMQTATGLLCMRQSSTWHFVTVSWLPPRCPPLMSMSQCLSLFLSSREAAGSTGTF